MKEEDFGEAFDDVFDDPLFDEEDDEEDEEDAEERSARKSKAAASAARNRLEIPYAPASWVTRDTSWTEDPCEVRPATKGPYISYF